MPHAWDEPIGQFVECLEQSGEEGPFWICAFAIYQSDDKNDGPTIAQQLGKDPAYGPFATVLKGAESMVAVITETCDFHRLVRANGERQNQGVSPWFCIFRYDFVLKNYLNPLIIHKNYS